MFPTPCCTRFSSSQTGSWTKLKGMARAVEARKPKELPKEVPGLLDLLKGPAAIRAVLQREVLELLVHCLIESCQSPCSDRQLAFRVEADWWLRNLSSLARGLHSFGFLPLFYALRNMNWQAAPTNGRRFTRSSTWIST